MNCSPGNIMTKIAHKVEVETGTKDGLQLTDTWGFFPPKMIVPSIQVNHAEINLHCWQKGDVLTKKLRSKRCDINLTESLLTSPLSLCLLITLFSLSSSFTQQRTVNLSWPLWPLQCITAAAQVTFSVDNLASVSVCFPLSEPNDEATGSFNTKLQPVFCTIWWDWAQYIEHLQGSVIILS